MIEKREIREEEIVLINYLLLKLNLEPQNYTLPNLVEEYEGGKMGSIGIGKPNAVYDGDLIQVDYKDTDGTDVVITLTKDTDNQLLDLDFWKVDFSKLLKYPKPENLVFKTNYTPFSLE
jgi:hypothetical protein